MRIWLITVGEPWPTDGNNPRVRRTGINAGFLANRGHDVTYWTSTFDQASKIERTGHDVEFSEPQNYLIVGLHAGTYQRNVSLKRIRYHREVGRRFRGEAAKRPVPDIIVVSLTPLELARAAVEYGRKKNIPVIVDVRDMWPDIWAEKLPGPLRSFRHLILKPFYEDQKRAVRGATAVVGITNAAVDWAMESTGRKRGSRDRAFPLIYPAAQPDEDSVASATAYWHSLGLGADPNEIIGCFFGTFTTRVDFETPLRALAEMPEPLRSRFRLVLCGKGENEALVARLTALTPQIICHGWVGTPQIVALMRMSRFGLLPYPPTLDFVRSLPNKVFEYLNGGLPILTSLRGEIEKLFGAYDCGALYDIGAPASFQALLTDLAGRPERLAAMAKGAREAAQAYDSTTVSAAFEAYLQSILVR